MPELPDLTVYREALASRIVGQPLLHVRLRNPFVLRTAVPPIGDAEGRRVDDVRRLGKRIVIALGGERYLVLHLMVAGRLRWLERSAKPPARITLATLEFGEGTLAFTEAGTKRRASLHYVVGEAALEGFDAGGLEIGDIDLAAFAARLASENHTLKRALTDPRLFAGIGNAYSDEILHRARLSPIALTGKLDDDEVARLFAATRAVLAEWIVRLRARGRRRISGDASRPFARRWPCTAASASHARFAARRCSASSMRRTSATIARAARPEASSSPIARSRGSCTRAGRDRSTRLRDPRIRYAREPLAVDLGSALPAGPTMPSFDIVSEVNQVEVRNAVDQTNKEVSTRFDFKGSDARVEHADKSLTLYADDDFKLKQVTDILTGKLTKRGVDIRALKYGTIEKVSGNKVKQTVTIRVGIEQELSKKIVKIVKDSKIKVQASIQGDAVRVSGGKRDDLQGAIALVKQSITDFPVQFGNFRD